MKECSQNFEESFSTNTGGIVRTCACGRTTYSYLDENYFEEGEFEELEEKSKLYPDKYMAVDYSVSTMNISGAEVVKGCNCDIAANFEKMILKNARPLADYLRKYAKELRQKADAVDVAEKE